MHSFKPAEESPSALTVERPSHPSFPPFHIVPGVSNFRDIGGWPTRKGHVRTGVLFRGSDTNRIKDEGIAKLHQLNIKTEFDLRSKQQIEKTGGYRDFQGIDRVWAPVFTDEQYTEEAAKSRYELYASEGTEGIVVAFVEILTSGAPMFHIVLRQLLDTVSPGTSSQPPALFMHCTTGNNRTGVFISLLLLLLGVPEEFVIKEYTLSDQGLAPTRHMNIERLLNKGAFQEYGSEEARRKCERMVGARAESMEALIKDVQTRWGGAEGYFQQEVHLSSEDIMTLKEVFHVEGKSIIDLKL